MDILMTYVDPALLSWQVATAVLTTLHNRFHMVRKLRTVIVETYRKFKKTTSFKRCNAYDRRKLVKSKALHHETVCVSDDYVYMCLSKYTR